MHSTNELSVIMATQFFSKWWKTKFHAGCSYKSISVLGSNVCDVRPSDTEELVRDDASSAYNNGAHINPGLASSSVSEVSHLQESPEYLHQHSNEVKFEDFECDVQVEGCESGEEKKEFSFTFYDFDGHGKITKDDIAGLVRSIYGAVNDSITVPQGGKKTIKVRLTVTPEKLQSSSSPTESTSNNLTSSPVQPTNSPNNNNNNINLTVVGMGNANSVKLESKPKLRNVNVTIKENLNRDRLGGGSGRKEKELRDRLSHLDKPKFNSVRIPNSAHAACRGCRNLSPEVFRDCSASPLRNRKKWRERVCSLQRPDIFDILQANMEKNNVNPCCRRDHSQQHQHSQQQLHHHHHSMAPCTHSQLIADPNCPVLPLLNENLCTQKQQLLMENCFPSTAAPPPRHHHYLGSGGKVYDAHIHRSSHHHSHQHQCKKHGHHRSRSHDLSENLFRHHLFPERDHLLTAPLPSAGGANQTCCSNLNSNIMFLEPQHNLQQQQDPLEILEGCFVNQHCSPRNKNTNLANATTQHQLKHRNREQEHARAMQQVISWLERENIGGCDKKFSSSPNRKNPNPSTNSLLGSPPAVKKHEHHHVHEHIHHHYHHHFSKETPIIV